MDPLSHAVLGAATAQSIARGPRGVAALAGVLGALLPDLDVLISSDADPLLALEYHRQFTHSFAFAPFGALIVAAVMWFVMRRRTDFSHLYWPALAGYASALLLDACTSYGTQLFWPFTDGRFAASIVAVIDPVVTVVLLIGVVLGLKSWGAKAPRAALAFVLAYLAFGWVQHERAESLIAQIAAQRGHSIAEHAVKPTLGNLLVWRSVYLTGDKFVIDAARVGIVSQPVLYPGGTVQRIKPIDLVPPLSMNSVQAADVVRFAQVSEGFLSRHPERPNVIGDIRYAMLPDSTEPLWGIAVHAERETEHVEFRTFREFTKEDRQKFFAMLRGVAPEDLRAADTKLMREPLTAPSARPRQERIHKQEEKP